MSRHPVCGELLIFDTNQQFATHRYYSDVASDALGISSPDASSGIHFAVFVSATSFHRLEDDITERWVAENCAGRRLSSDDGDRGRRIVELRVGDAKDSHLRR
jgi:hypothetical protein